MLTRRFLLFFALGCFLISTVSPMAKAQRVGLNQASKKKPNIIFIMADDLGYGELGCFGQKKIKTPNIDMLADQGMKLTQHYSGSPVCAPSRCVLLTGYHAGHAYIRSNSPWARKKNPYNEGQEPLPANTVTVARLLKKQGYTTGAFGKWGLGGPGTTGEPHLQGFDEFLGYLCQWKAHNFYPTHLWHNGKKYPLNNQPFSAHQRIKQPPANDDWSRFSGKEYAPDVIHDAALSFIKKNKNRPFFLYLPTTVPHVSLQVPQDSLNEYPLEWDQKPYLGERGYLPHPRPRAAYAAMVTRMDMEVGRIMTLLKELKLEENTLIIFTSDNGATFNGGYDRQFFNGNGPLREGKCTVYEGGIRVPFVARWPGHIKSGSSSDHISAFQDLLPTLMEVAGSSDKTPDGIDGISFMPALLGKSTQQKQHQSIYFEYNGQQAVRMGHWKAVRKRNSKSIELYDLSNDTSEKQDVAEQHPDVVAKMEKAMTDSRSPSKIFPLVRKPKQR